MKLGKLLTVIAVCVAGSTFGIVHANEYMTAEQVKSLFTNKTFNIHNIAKDKHLQGYDTEDGKHLVFIPWKDKISKRKWWVEDNKHCTSHPKRGDSCKDMKDMGDGSYQGFTDGKHTHTLSNFREGKRFDM